MRSIHRLFFLFLVGAIHAQNVREVLEREVYPRGGWFAAYPGSLLFEASRSEGALSLPRVDESLLPAYGRVESKSALGISDDFASSSKREQGFVFDDDELYEESAPSCPVLDEKEVFASMYKIHLMPKPDDIIKVADIVAREISQNKDFARLVSQLKIPRVGLPVGAKIFKNFDRPNIFFDASGNVIPFIVLYAQPQCAQELVNRLDGLLHNYEGVQVKDFPESVYGRLQTYLKKMGRAFGEETYVTPRFSIAAATRNGLRTSSLIYYAQGNGDYKMNLFGPYTFMAQGTLFEPLWHNARNLPDVIAHEDGSITVPGYARLFDPASNGALLYADYLGDVRDFHLYLSDEVTHKKI